MATAHAHPHVHSLITHDALPSPTLTNPDLILPWQVSASSPAPLASSPTLHSNSSTPPTLGSKIFETNGVEAEPKTEFGVAKAVVMPFRMKPPPPTSITPAWNGDYDHGPPLSDIGEEESTPRSRRTRSRTSSPGLLLSPTPSAGPTLVQRKRLSSKSDSSAGSDIGDWENFDSSKMMNARLAADVAKAGDEDLEGTDSMRNSLVTADDEMAKLNLRAERILANAKKRLTHMENNLSNARNSTLFSPKSSPILGDFHQPVGALYRSISQGGDRRPGQNYIRKSKPLYPVIKSLQTGHSRGLSGDSAEFDFSNHSRAPQTRSASAMEYGRRLDSMLPDRSPAGPIIGHSPSSSRSYNSPLQVLEEEEGSPSTNMTSPHTPAARGLGISTASPTGYQHKRQDSDNSNGLARSSSQTSTRSTRELREQMSDLKTRIADLKQKAQADQLSRQSTQSLKTPSPFTHAPERWYTAAPEYKEAGTPINTNAGLGWSPSQGSAAQFGTPRSPQSLKDSAFGDGAILTPATAGQRSDYRTDVNTSTLHQKTIKLSPTVDRPIPFAQGSYYEDAPEEFDEEGEDHPSQEEQVYLNEVLEESLHNGEPGIPIMLDEDYEQDEEAERHEDRVDAFDYENMFLHSALGNGSHSEPRSRSNSDSSVETRRAATRTPVAEDEEDDEGDDEQSSGRETNGSNDTAVTMDDEPQTPRASLLPPAAPWMRPSRSNSMDSVTTTATFETAMEGVEGESEDDEMPAGIMNWGNRVSPVQQPRTSPQQSAWPTPPTSGNRPVSRGKQMYLGMSPARQATNGLSTLPVRSTTLPIQLNGPHGQAHPANTEILMASLITLADPGFRMPNTPNAFADVDKGLVIGLLRALGGACDGILKSEARGELYEARVWRRKVDEARRMLEGRGMDGEGETT